MKGKKFDSTAAALLLLLDGAPAKAGFSAREAADLKPGRSAASFPTAENAEAAAAAGAAGFTDELLPPERRTASSENGFSLPGQTFSIPSAAAAGEASGTEDPMEIIDGFFRRDSRRYDGGFYTERVL